MATSLRTRSYGLRAFHDEMLVLFPELQLYMSDGRVSSGATGHDFRGGGSEPRVDPGLST